MPFTHEDDFIKKLEAYLNVSFDMYSKNRINTILKEYRAADTPVVQKVTTTNEKIRVITKFRIIDSSKLKKCTPARLEAEARKICEKHNVPYEPFVQSVYRKSPCNITAARKEFCRVMLTKYNTERKQLQDFLHVDHSSIITYLKEDETRVFFKEAI